jgi:4-amino-4-deoxy-L-arabinose transferase-like glycosyltransferase
LVAAVVLSLLLRAPFLGLPMVADEGGYAYVADRWLDGEGRLYQDVWVSRPQGIVLLYGLVLQAPGSSTVALRLAAWLACVLTLLCVWRYARAWAGPGPAAVAAVAFATIASAPAIEGFTANAEVFMALPAAAAAWLLLRLPGSDWPRRSLLLVGALAGVATLLKPSGLVVLPVAVAFAWLEGAAGPGAAARRSGWLFAGFAAALVPALVHGWLLGWHEFVYASATYRLAEQSPLTYSALHQFLHFGRLIAESWWLTLALFVPFWGRQRAIHGRLLARLPGGVWGFLRSAAEPESLRRRIDNGGRDPGGTLLRLWLLGCLAGMAMGGDWWAHYLIQAAAPLAIGLGVLLRDATPPPAPYRRLAVGAVVAVLLLAPYRVAALMDPDRISQAVLNNCDYPVADEVGTYLKEHTTPDTTIFVAFNDASVYYLADRPTPFRYFFNQELRAFPDAEAQLVALLNSSNRPEILVQTCMPAPFPDGGQEFWKTVADHYQLEEADIAGVKIYRAIEGSSGSVGFVEPLRIASGSRESLGLVDVVAADGLLWVVLRAPGSETEGGG